MTISSTCTSDVIVYDVIVIPTKMSFNRKIDKLTVVCPYSEILLDNKKKEMNYQAIKVHRKKKLKFTVLNEVLKFPKANKCSLISAMSHSEKY